LEKRPKYLALVHQIDRHCKRLLRIGHERKTKTLLRFFRWFSTEHSRQLRYICSDMWKPYLKVTAKKAGWAVHVLDRVHIMAYFSKALNEVRAHEVKVWKATGLAPVLTKARWVFLKRPQNLTSSQEIKLADLLQYKLSSVRTYLLKEEFQFCWTYISPPELADSWIGGAPRPCD
jgi:transposase